MSAIRSLWASPAYSFSNIQSWSLPPDVGFFGRWTAFERAVKRALDVVISMTAILWHGVGVGQ
jgi:hypothetical protein